MKDCKYIYVQQCGDRLCMEDRIGPMPTRPLLDMYGGVIVAWDKAPDEPMLMRALQRWKELDLLPLDHYGAQTLLFDRNSRKRLLTEFGLTKLIAQDSTQIPRLSKLVAFTCEAKPFQLQLRGTPFSSKDRDGPVIISDDVDQMYQVRVLGHTAEGHRCIAKGTIRPPEEGEQEAYLADWQFGKMVDPTKPIAVYPISDLQPQKPSLNHQALIFTVRQPIEFMAKDLPRLEKTTPIDVVSKDHKPKIAMGIPAGLLLDNIGPWKWLRKYPIKGGARLAVQESPLLDRNELYLGKPAADRLKLRRGQAVSLLRDPAKPDASGIQHYHYAGEFGTQEAIYLHPQNAKWKQQGGDFDGDYAVLIPKALQTHEVVGTEKPYTARKRSIPVVDGKVQYETAVLARQGSFEAMVGSIILTASKLWEMGELKWEGRKELSELAQAAIDAKKHPIDHVRCRKSYNPYLAAMAGSGPFFTDFVAAIQAANGWDAKVKAWNDLGFFLQSSALDSQFHCVMWDRWKEINRLFVDCGYLRGSRLQLPTILTDITRAHLLADEKGPEMAAAAKKMAVAYRTAVAASNDGTEASKLTVQLCRAEIETAYKEGAINAAALLTYIPARLAAELVTVADLRKFKVTMRSYVLCLKQPTTDGIYSSAELEAASTQTFELQMLMSGFEEARVTVLETRDGYVRANVEPIRTEHVEITDDIDFD